jgi:putative peptidoglycan lipid II flippase
MRAVFAHGAFDSNAATVAALTLAAYGLGLPAMALIRIIASTFYARHDTATPVRATLLAMACNIALKIFFVWGLELGVAGIALGTALGAWINIALLTWLGRSRDLLAIETQFVRALPASLLAALAVGAGAWAGVWLLRDRGDIPALAAAIACAALGYGAVLLLLRGRLPLGRARAS